MKIFKKLFQYIFKLSPMILGAGLVLGGMGEALGQNPRIFTTPGDGTFTVPAGVTSITVEVWGAGGRGGSRTSNGEGGGGGGGAYSRSVIAVTPGQVFNYYVGFGSLTNQAGEDSWFSTNTILMAKGGNSVGENITAGATGGSAAAGVGDFKRSGGNGANAASGEGGGGGSSAGITANGNHATNRNGAPAPSGGGIGGNGKNGGQGRGNDGANPGGGGGGALRSNASGTEQVGGYGGNGQIRISYIALTSATGTDNQSVCVTSPITTTTYSFPPSSTVSVTTLPAGLTSSPNSAAGTLTISGTPTSSGTYTITVTPSYFSSIPLTLTKNGSVTIVPNNTVNSTTPNQTRCIDTALTPITHTTTGATGIANNGVSGANGLPPGVSATWNAGVITISGTPTSSVGSPYNYSILLTGGCGTIYATGTITVTPDNTLTPVTPTDQTKCINVGLTPITFNTTGATGISNDGIAGANGLPTGVSATWAANSITISGTPTVSGTFNYTIPMTGGCGTVNATGIITVTPDNTATAIGSSNQSQCINEALVDITFNTTGTTGISNNGVAGANGLPPGVSATWNANVITISGTPTSTAGSPYNYSIPLNGGCGTIFATGTITVTPDNTLTPTTPTDQTKCVNVGLSAITFTTTGATGISNAGIQGANGLPAGVSATWAGNTITISGTPTVDGTFNYSIPLIGGCNDLYAEGTITVNPATEITSENLADQRICDGANFAQLSVTASGNGTLSYQWYSNTVSATSGPNLMEVGNDTNAYTPPADEIGTKYYFVIVSSQCAPDAISTVSKATVEPITTITSDIDTSDDVECFQDGFDPLTVLADGADLTYQWYVNTNQQNSGGTLIPGATTNTYTPPSTDIGSFLYYYVVVSGYCTSNTSVISGEYRVNPPETVIDDDPDTTNYIVCKGDTFPELEVLASGEGTITYQWYSNDVAQNTGGIKINGATEAKYTPSSDVVGTKYYYATGKSNCGTVPTEVSGSFTVTQPSVVTSESLDAQEICENQSFAPISIIGDGTGTIEYQWYSNTLAVADTLSPEVIELAGEDADSFTPPTTLGTLYYFVKVSSECGPNVLSSISGAFTVNPLPVPTLTSDADADPFVCEGTSVTYTTEPLMDDYDWDIEGIVVDDYTLTFSGPSFEESNSITVTWLTDGTKDVSVSYTDPNGCTADTPAVNSITVDPLPVPTLISSEDADPIICKGGSVIYTTEAGKNNYVWNIEGIVADDYTLTFTGPSLDQSNSITVTWLTAGIKDVTVSYTDPSTGCIADIPASKTITVDPLPTVTNAILTQSICSGGSTTQVDLTSDVPGTTYTWTVSATAGITGFTASGTGPIPVQTISTTGTTQGTVTYVITPEANGCPGPSTNYTVLIDPLATVGLPSVAFPSVCISDPSSLSFFTRTTTGVTGIANSGVTGVNGLPPGISANFDSDTGVITFSGTATTTGLFTYNIPLTGNCINGLTASGTIDVTPDYELSSVSAVSATVEGGTARVIINGTSTNLPNGEYIVTYELNDGTSPPADYTSPSFIVSNGRGIFPTIPLTDLDVEVYKVTIKTIKKITDVCEVDLDVDNPDNIAYFSVCGATFDQNGTFYVPAGIYEVTIVAKGAGSTGQSDFVTIPVTPGESLGVFIGQDAGSGAARDTYVTRDPSDPNPSSTSIIYVAGGGSTSTNGAVVISYNCPDPSDLDCIDIIDDGAKSGTTVIRFNCINTYSWDIPEGLVEFSVYAIGGGGGGGMGSTGGGGGGGGIDSTVVSSTSPFGIPAGNSLDIKVGIGGPGAPTVNIGGINGGNSTVTATIPDPGGNININLNAMGGGGGGSFNNRDGKDGASGGGGAYSDQVTNLPGQGGSGTSGQGNNGGSGGKGNGANHARAGGGGGGAGSPGGVGDGAGVGLSKPGDGGEGSSFALSGSTYGYGAGGGGIGYNFNGESDRQGVGGEVNGVILGGTASRDGIGGDGTIYTGSGGGAGRFGGGRGGSGVVFITYFNFSILNVEYQYFNANYNPKNRSGELTWATSKEWENSHFEIERAVNNVKTWTKIGEVNGQGYSDTTVEYNFTDTELPAVGGNIFYRLKQVDMDGDFSYSVTRSIQVNALEGTTAWIAYPNPSDIGSSVTVALLDDSGYTDGTIQIRVSDIRGIFQTYTVQNPEDVSAAVNSYLENARPGMYIVQLFWGDKSEQMKLVRK